MKLLAVRMERSINLKGACFADLDCVTMWFTVGVCRGVTEVAGNEDHRFLVSTRRQGTWADSELEKTLKVLISFAKGYPGEVAQMQLRFICRSICVQPMRRKLGHM